MVPQTKSSVTPPPHNCPLEECLSFLAGAWTPKILWYLQNKPRRFGDLKRDLGSVSAKVLTTRLRELEAKGLVSRTVMPTSPPTVEYALTEFGKTFMPVLQSILEVGLELRKRTKGEEAMPLADENCTAYAAAQETAQVVPSVPATVVMAQAQAQAPVRTPQPSL